MRRRRRDAYATNRSYNGKMAATLLAPAPAEDALYRLTGEQYDAMVESGALGPDDPVELIDGLLIQKMPQNAPHATAIVKLNRWLVLNAGEKHSIRPQVPLRLRGSTRPEPNLAVVQGDADDFPEQPTGEQVLLTVEIADKALDAVLRRKALLYAQNGVRELWIVNVERRTVELHRQPSEDGYRSVAVLAEMEPFAPLFLPGQTLRGAEILPKQSADDGERG